MTLRGPPTSIDLSACDREPIHVPGAIQPHGVLFALDEGGRIVEQVSANVSDVLHAPVEEVLGRPLDALFDSEVAQAVRAALESDLPAEASPIPVVLGAARFDGVVHRHQSIPILELERPPPGAEAAAALELDREVRRSLARVQGADTLQGLLDVTVREVRRLTGFDRVLLYRFHEDEHGEVIAEDKRPELEPYLGLHYPASDIPSQARELYRLNWLRLIPQATYAPVPLVPEHHPSTGRPLDMSFAVLRSVSPVHREYLRNMGLAASMSISLLVDGRLWGLITCGHRVPRYAPYSLRRACELVGRLVSLQIRALEQLEQARVREQLRVLEAPLIAAMERADTSAAALVSTSPEVLDLVGAAGVALWSEGRVSRCGVAPPEVLVHELVLWLRDRMGEGQLHSSALPHEFAPAERYRDVASGLLAVSLPKPGGEYLLWFRPEVIETVRWGGDPRHSAEVDPVAGQLHPRRSFALWKESVRGTALPWRAAELDAAWEIRRRAVELDLQRQVERERAARRDAERATDEARRAVQARDDLVAIVSHDLRNPLSAVEMQAARVHRLLGREGSPPVDKILDALAHLRRSARRMGALIGDLLDVAKIETERFILERRPERVGSLVDGALEVLGPAADQKGIDLIEQVDCPELTVAVDADRIFQVLSNLLGNAVKFTPAGGAVRVAVTASERELRFEVADSGPGIPEEERGHLFERFWQGRAPSRSGVGLGLYITKGIVEAHGGSIGCDSEVGAGSTFFFTLPRDA